MSNATHVPAGWPCLIPRIVSTDAAALVIFIREVFGAQGDYNANRPTELHISGSMLLVSTTDERDDNTAFLYIYVEDTDATHRRAVDRGATSIEALELMPYGDRRSMVRDPWGNTWQIATHSGSFTP